MNRQISLPLDDEIAESFGAGTPVHMQEQDIPPSIDDSPDNDRYPLFGAGLDEYPQPYDRLDKTIAVHAREAGDYFFASIAWFGLALDIWGAYYHDLSYITVGISLCSLPALRTVIYNALDRKNPNWHLKGWLAARLNNGPSQVLRYVGMILIAFWTISYAMPAFLRALN